MDEKAMKVLIEKLPKKGMSKDCQDFIPKIAEYYFKGHSLSQTKEYFSTHQGFADIIYHRIEQIKNDGLKKVSHYFGKHPKDLKEDYLFANSIIEYSLKRKNLEKEISKTIKLVNIDIESKKNLEKKYIDKENVNVKKELNDIARSPEFYLFISEKLMKD